MTPEYFSNKIKVNFPEIYNRDASCFARHAGITLQLQSLVSLIIEDNMSHTDFVMTIGARERLNAAGLENLSFNILREIELDYLYEYIKNNIDLIHFRLL